MPSTLTPHARAPAGISSAATTAMSTARAVEKPRATVWLAVYHGSEGASPVVAANRQPPTAETSSSFLRPWRSARLTMPTARKMARRATASATVWGRSPWSPKSSEANVMVWVIEVPRYPATREAKHSAPRAFEARASSRSAGAHHGRAAPGVRRALRMGRASSQAKYGMARRNSAVEVTWWRPSPAGVTSTVRR